MLFQRARPLASLDDFLILAICYLLGLNRTRMQPQFWLFYG